MPVDPNEPTYCLCHQVSYGEMIGCDNPDVSFLFKNVVQISKFNEFSRFLAVPHRVVPLCVRRADHQTEGQVVLSKVLTGSQKEVSSSWRRRRRRFPFCDKEMWARAWDECVSDVNVWEKYILIEPISISNWRVCWFERLLVFRLVLRNFLVWTKKQKQLLRF